jgi:hypothetical protein
VALAQPRFDQSAQVQLGWQRFGTVRSECCPQRVAVRDVGGDALRDIGIGAEMPFDCGPKIGFELAVHVGMQLLLADWPLRCHHFNL